MDMDVWKWQKWITAEAQITAVINFYHHGKFKGEHVGMQVQPIRAPVTSPSILLQSNKQVFIQPVRKVTLLLLFTFYMKGI